MIFWYQTVTQEYIEELNMICDIFCNELIPVARSKWGAEDKKITAEFDDYRKRCEMLRESKSNPTCYSLADNFNFPAEYQLDNILEEWHMKYNSYLRVAGIGIANIVMLWEQQLCDQLNHFDENITNYYPALSSLCSKLTTHDLENDLTIKEIRNLVNVIKHGKNTRSYKWLEEHNSKYLITDITNQFSEPVERYLYIDISIDDIQSINNYLVNFWREFKFNDATVKSVESCYF